MKTLIVVDPQYDFVTGTLPVPGAEDALNRLSDKLIRIAPDQIIVTMDCHPIGHVSFEPSGGVWPVHCVKYSHGAAVWEPLMKAIQASNVTTLFLEKGRAMDKDEYSAFGASFPDILNGADSIMVCGLAGDVCVLNSIMDLLKHGLGSKLCVIEDASPSLDGGEKLQAFIRENNLKAITLDAK